MEKNDPSVWVNWLEGLGYQVAFRVSGWTECLIWRPGERWLGSGADDVGALSDAIGRMLPSHAAWAGVPDEVRRALAGTTEPPVEPAAQDTPDDLVGPAPCVREVFDEELVPIPTEPLQAEAPPVTEAAPVVLLSTEATPVAPAPPAPKTVDEAPVLPVDDALAGLAPLVDRISAERPELGLASPQRQRLVLLAWICRARAIEQASGDAAPVVERVAWIAKELTGLCKLWWPGSVRALQLYATPDDVGRELGGTAADLTIRSWEEAARATEERLVRVIESDPSEGKDEYGWADGPALLPAPLDPTGDLRALRAWIEKVAGSVDESPPRRPAAALRNPGSRDIAVFTDWARLARWLRGCTVDFETWARIAGRLRWIAGLLGEGGTSLAQALDPAFCPKSSWATALGRDPEAQRRKRERLGLYRRLATVDRSDPERIRAWLVDALGLIDADAVLRAVRPFRDVVLAVDADSPAVGARAERRRLRKVQAALEADGPGPHVPVVDPEIAEALAAPIEDAPAAKNPTADLFARVRPLTDGRRAAFVGNRNDPELEAMLREALGFASIDWCEGSPRRVQTVVERIGQGAYDFVLGATGFQSHSVDGKLFDACRKTKVPYIRVNKGRPVACAAAILRREAAAA